VTLFFSDAIRNGIIILVYYLDTFTCLFVAGQSVLQLLTRLDILDGDCVLTKRDIESVSRDISQ